MDESGLDSGPSRTTAAVESLQRVGDAPRLQLAVGCLGVPTLVGYLFPVRLAYTVQVLVTLVIAGTGMYVLGRVLRLGVLGCVMAAVAYELGGPFVGWLGWPITAVTAWAGWLFAAAILVVRGRRRARAMVFLAVVVACAIYAGQPDMLTVLASGLFVFLAALLATRATWAGGSGPIARPMVDLTVGTVTGAALGAPLLLPGLQLVSGSLRSGKGLSNALPAQNIVLALFQGFDGLPVAGSRWFGPSSYTPSTTYVGVIAVVLAVLAVVARSNSAHVDRRSSRSPSRASSWG